VFCACTALAAALAGQRVVRLKSGDPFIYGRGGEEVLFFRKHGIECLVVAGISSVIAGPMAQGVPVLMRGFADQLFVGTGSTRGDKPPEVPEYSPTRTYVYLMVRPPIARMSRPRSARPTLSPSLSLSRSVRARVRVFCLGARVLT
jgi:siroheme synthase